MKKRQKQNRLWRRQKKAELLTELAQKRRELLLAKMKLSRGQLKNTRLMRELHYQIAVLATYIREKTLLAEFKEQKHEEKDKN